MLSNTTPPERASPMVPSASTIRAVCENFLAVGSAPRRNAPSLMARLTLSWLLIPVGRTSPACRFVALVPGGQISIVGPVLAGIVDHPQVVGEAEVQVEPVGRHVESSAHPPGRVPRVVDRE